ncbi:retrograde protein of 51 kDa-like [Babylonia areolata]|uniref:retrograde protein of 51 kDa-like n=1 Tax=Babylonia areolata TaxID=304850 RepID=UPI003FCEE92D
MKTIFVCFIFCLSCLLLAHGETASGSEELCYQEKQMITDLQLRNTQLEKQYQDLLREMEQREQDHTLEINQLKDEMNKLRAEKESMLVELQTLMDAKVALELKIAAYRKLLETEESRVSLRSLTSRRRP